MANGNWWDKYAVGANVPENEEDSDQIAVNTADDDEQPEEQPKENWWEKYAVDKVKPEVGGKADEDLLKRWDEITINFESLQESNTKLGERYSTLATLETRTPEEESEMNSTWKDYVRSGFEVQSAIKNVNELQPSVDAFYEKQKQQRTDYIEGKRDSAIFGDTTAEALYALDQQSAAEYDQARLIPNRDERKKAIADISAKYQTEERNLLNSKIEDFKGQEQKITGASAEIGQAWASGRGFGQWITEMAPDTPETRELQQSFFNQDDPEKGGLYREALAMNKLAIGEQKAGIVNGEIRISPMAVWNSEDIKNEINNLDISERKKELAIKSIPALQEEAAKVELPFLQQVSEFNSFVKDNNLQDASPKDQIFQWKNRNEGWMDYVAKAPTQAKLGLAYGFLGLIDAAVSIGGATTNMLGVNEISDPLLDLSRQTGDKIQQYNRISQEIGGPTIVAEFAAIVPQLASQLAVGGGVALGGAKMGLKPKMVSNIGFGSSIGMAMAQSYGGVLSDAIRTLEDQKIEQGIDPIRARAEAVKEAQLPAALSGLSTGIITVLGGKRGAEGVFREGSSAIKAKLNTPAFKAELDRFLPNVAKGLTNEGLEELADELAQGFIAQATFNPELSTSDIVNNAAKAFILGAAAGSSIEGIKYGFDYAMAPRRMEQRKETLNTIGQSIQAAEKEISDYSASTPIGSDVAREYDATLPSDGAAILGGRAVDRDKMARLQSERAQLQSLLQDDTITRVARNDLEGRLAATDVEYYNDVLLPMRRNVLAEQISDTLETMASSTSKDAISAMAKVANERGLDSLTGRERAAVGITKVGDNRFIPSKQNPMLATDENGNVTITETGKRVAETVGIPPLVRMIGVSENMRNKLQQIQETLDAAQQERAKQEAKDAAEAEDAKRYGPESAQALKDQANAVTPAGGPVDERVANLLRAEEEERKRAEAIFAERIPTPPAAVAAPSPEVTAPSEAGITPVTPEVTVGAAPEVSVEAVEARPVVAPESLNTKGRQANKILTAAGIDPETAAFVAQQYQDEIFEMGGEELRAFILDKFEENGGVVPSQMRYSEDPEYYQLAFNVGLEEANQMVENAKASNVAMAQSELEQNRNWRRKDEQQQVTQAQQGAAQVAPETQAVPVTRGEVATRPAIEGRRVPALAAPTEVPVAPIPEPLSLLRRVVRQEQTEEDVAGLVDSGFVEIYRGQPVLTQAGVDALPEAERPRLTPEARKIQIDTKASDAAAEAIYKGLRIGVDQVAPDAKMPAGWTLVGDVYIPPAKLVEITEAEANAAVEGARADRAKKKPVKAMISNGRALSLSPSSYIGKTVREALIAASRINLSNFESRKPNEITMQDVAAILSKLDLSILDIEKIQSLSSVRRRGRAFRETGESSAIYMTSGKKSRVETLVHEVGHTLTADQINRYAPRRKVGSGKQYLDAINKVINDPTVPEPVRRLFGLYTSTIDQLGLSQEYFSDRGIAGTPTADASVAAAQRRQDLGRISRQLEKDQLYGLANIEEFVAQTFSSTRFRYLLRSIKDPNDPRRSAWSAFVEAIQRILQLPRESMAAAVIEASIDVAREVPADRVITAGKTRSAKPIKLARRRVETDMEPEAREGRAFVTPEENARFMELAQDPETNRDELQSMVDRVADRLGFNSENLLFHGTTHIFNVFRRDRANVENDFGKGYYFTNTDSDAQINYATEGPDLTSRIERLSEQLQDNEDLDEEAARAKAREILSGGGQRIIRAYVNLQNPFNIGGDNETFLELNQEYNEETGDYEEPSGSLVRFMEALRPIIESYTEDSAVDADKAIGRIYEEAIDRGGLSASDLVRVLKSENSGIIYANDENGDSATNEIIRQAIEEAGFDGIVDSLVNQKFGTGKRVGTAMRGMGEGTVHTIVFNSNQIKSADAVTYDADGNVIPLDERFDITREEIEFEPEEDFVIDPASVNPPPVGSAADKSIKVMGKAIAMGDRRSAELGDTQGALSIQTIVTAWMDSGRSRDDLEVALIRYTNLSATEAQSFATAFSSQYKIQQGLMELAPREDVAEVVEEEKKPYSFAERASGKLRPSERDRISRVYSVLRNEVSIEEATQVLSNLSLDEAINAVKDMNNGISFGVRSMMAQIVEKRLIRFRNNQRKAGNLKEWNAAIEAHVDFFNWISDYSKELGQGIQAFAQWINLGPQGIVRKLRRDTEKVIDKNIKQRKKRIDKIKSDVESSDNKSFEEAKTRNKKTIESLGNQAAKDEAKIVTIEDQARKIAERLAKRVAGEDVRPRKIDPLSELVNAHARQIDPNFVQKAMALGISEDTANKINDSAIKLDQDRRAAKDQREAFQKAQEARAKISRDLARENKYIYGDRPTVWEDYQAMFAERMAKALLRDPKKTTPPSLLLFTNRLTRNLIGFIPETERAASTPQSFQAIIEDAINNKDRYQEAFNMALKEVSLRADEALAKIGGGEALSEQVSRALAAQEFMEKLAPTIEDFPVSEKLIQRFVAQKTRDLDISLAKAYNNWYRADRRTRMEMEQMLADTLIQDVNINSNDARKLSNSIVKEFKQKAEERRKKALEQFKKPKEKVRGERAAQTEKLQRFFELVNMGAMSDMDAYEIMAQRYDLPTYDEDFVAYVEEAAQSIQGMDEGLARRKKTMELMTEISRQRGFNPSDMGTGFVYANMLSSPETHLVNIVDTAMNIFANGFADAIADRDLTRLRGIVAGYRKGVFEFIEIMKTGQRINVPGFEEKAPQILERILFGTKGGVAMSTEGVNGVIKSILESKPAAILNLAKFVGRFLESQDALNFNASSEGQRYSDAARMAAEEGFTGAAARKRMNEILNLGDDAYQKALQQALTEGYVGAEAKYRAMEIRDEAIPEEIKNQSFERGLRDVYRNTPTGVAGYLADAINGNLRKIKNPLIYNIARITVAPFIITPINLFNKWLDWSPWGYKRLFFGSGKWVGDKYVVEPFEKGSQERRVQIIKANSSILVLALSQLLIRAGIMSITGRGPSDEEERKQWLADGNKPYTIRFGNGPAFSFAITPWAMPLSVLANMENWNKYNAKDDDSFMYRLMASMAFIPGIVSEIPFYQGVSDLVSLGSIKSQAGFESRFKSFTEGKLGMLFPNFLRYVDRMFDPTRYSNDGVKGMLLGQIPFARRLNGPMVNMFGDPIGEGKPLIERFAGRFVNFPEPTRESLILAKFDAYPYIPSPKEAKTLVDGEPTQMTPKQYEEFIVGSGKELKKFLNENFNPDDNLTPAQIEAGRKRIFRRAQDIRAKWRRKVGTRAD